MKKPKSKTKGGPKVSGHEMFNPNPNMSTTTGGKKGSMTLPKGKSSGSGANKAGGGRDSGAAKAL